MTPLYIANKNEIPQGGYRYHQAETHYTITAPSWQDLLNNVKKHRIANNIPIGLEFDRQVEQQLAEAIPSSQVTADNPNRSAEVPKEDWPLWAKTMALAKSDSDTGVGDTIYRLIGETNSEAFKKWHQTIMGRPCSCTERRESFNNQFPY